MVFGCSFGEFILVSNLGDHKVQCLHMGCSQKCGPLLVIDDITAPNIWGYPSGSVIFGHIQQEDSFLGCLYDNELYSKLPTAGSIGII